MHSDQLFVDCDTLYCRVCHWRTRDFWTFRYGVARASRRESGVNDSASEFGQDWNVALPPEARALADQLFPLFYDELRRLAQRERRRVGAGVTLQTTALVNEAYLKLRRGQGWRTDAHFLRACALAMRHALVNHAATRQTAKRGGGEEVQPLTAMIDIALESDASILALNDALDQLAQESPRLAQVVECRYFAGFSDVETGRALGISERSVRSDWTLARAWLHRELAVAPNDCMAPASADSTD
jgi:RNA polymerase sigma factor (TIGR02999 family)